MAKKSASISDENINNYMELSEKYGMWLPSIYERLQERLVRPLQIAQMCGLVGEAIEDVRSEKPKTAFKRLEEQVEQFAQAPMGTGFELPEWLNTLQDEVLDYQSKTGHADNLEQLENILNPQIVCDIICLSRSDIEKQLTYCKNNIDFKE